MRRSVSRPSRLLVVSFGVAMLAPRAAHAHFVLQAPPSWMTQDASGLPEKLGPCGDEADDAGGVPTGIVTAFQAGQTITVTIDEVVFHPGHYRVALAVHDRSELPAEPVVTPSSDSPCGTAAVESPASFPVLADGVLDHTSPFGAPQSITVQLPPGVTCEKCTLQVIEFMAEHPLNNPGGCFYHHCADIAVQASPGDAAATDAAHDATSAAAPDAARDATTTAGPDAMPDGAPGATRDAMPNEADAATPPGASSPASGCACVAAPPVRSAGFGLPIALALALLGRRRSRRP